MQTFFFRCNQRQSHPPLARVGPGHCARQVTARQCQNILACKKYPGEILIGHGQFRPQVKAGLRRLAGQGIFQDLAYRRELFLVQPAVFDHVFFVRPGRNACRLRRQRQGAAMVGAVLQELLDQAGIAGHEARTHAGGIGAFRQAVEGEAIVQAVLPGALARRQQAHGRRTLRRIDLRVTLIGGDHEIVAFRVFHQLLQRGLRGDLSGRVAGGAQVHQLHALPERILQRPQRGDVPVHHLAVVVDRLGTCKQGRTFIDLVEGVGNQHRRVVRGIDHALCAGKQGLARAVDRQYVGVLADDLTGQGKALHQPVGKGRSQGLQAAGGRVAVELRQGLGVGIQDVRRGRMARLPHRQGDRLKASLMGMGLDQPLELLERIGLQLFQVRVHGFGTVPQGMRSRCGA